jgi:anti-anti-sigma regulatory factor
MGRGQAGDPPKTSVAKTSKGAGAAKTIDIGRDLRIAGAAEVFGRLRALAAGPEKRVTLDARQVEKVDAAGLQALLAGMRAVTDAGKTVAWVGVSAQLLAASELLGLAGPLGIRS